MSSKIRDHFVRHVAAPGPDRHEPVAAVPEAEVIEALIDAAFWASLRREEGFVPRISLAFLPPHEASPPLRFERSLPLDPRSLARLAPAVDLPGLHLGVWPERGSLCVWGTTRALPTFCFVLEVVAPGVLIVKHSRREETAKFVNVAMLEGDQVKILDQRASTLPGCPTVLASLLGFETPAVSLESANVLVRLALSMRAHRRGGSLLVVPAASEQWRESIVHPISYTVRPPYTEIAALVRAGPGDGSERQWREDLGRAVETVAALTAVDGATVMTDQFELLAFGAKIGRRADWREVEQVVVTEPVENGAKAVVHPAQLGGTRHLSAAQFVHDQREALALVASQDGAFTIFAWSPPERMVHAHRVEALLL